MKTFQRFKQDINEAVPLAIPARIALKTAGSKFLLPALMTGIGAAGTLYQTTKKSGPFADTGGFDASKSRTKRQYFGLPPSTNLTKQEKKDRKIKGQQDIINKRDDQIAREGPGDLVPGAKRERLKKLLSDFKKRYLKNLEDKKAKNDEIDRRLGKK
tara:strand:+ start:42 stop:512 length:471 start_codon:yes stop_codon:yes gene_type:complete